MVLWIADIHHPRGKSDARCRFGGDLRLRIRLLTVVRFPCAFRHLHIRKSSREAGIFRAACIYAKPNFSGSFEHVANPHLRKLHPVPRTFYAVVIFAPAEPIPHGFYVCRNRGRRPVRMLMYGKVSQENYVELTAASAIPNKEIKSPQILRY